MDSFYYLLGLVGVVWLVLWTIRPPRRGVERWAPFDMKEGDDIAPKHVARRWQRRVPDAPAAPSRRRP